MRSVVTLTIWMVLLIAPAARGEKMNEEGWAVALPGYQITLPQDHFPHYQFRTEWWYFTGNVSTADGRPFGYQLTFFRHGYRPPGVEPPVTSRFVMNEVKFAHFAVTDISAGKFHFDGRVSRGAFGEAGFADGNRLAWIDNWELGYNNNNFNLMAAAQDYAIELELMPERPAVRQGADGLSQKAAGEGHASYYYSITRLKTSGTIKIGSASYKVEGSSWFDREWATNQLTPEQSGWNWFAIQLSDGSDLMLYQMRLKNGGIDSHSDGKWIAPDGASSGLSADDFHLVPEKYWTSPANKASYPVEWKLTIPKLSLDLQISPALENQELNLSVVYWEGSVRFKGRRAGKAVDGVGYMELTGYQGKAPGLAGSTR
ncbi:MAG: carotenoid 1,2-hydratase [Verrucomicrobia bacterium]|nr:carotenoid 1,2-hydratase [Verrucomicrobiota bacterium]